MQTKINKLNCNQNRNDLLNIVGGNAMHQVMMIHTRNIPNSFHVLILV